jgi:cell division protein FtsZ
LGGRNLSLLEAFKKADDILYHAVKGISDLIIVPGLINLDFADVKNIMSEMGLALMGTGSASGENRAIEAAQKAISLAPSGRQYHSGRPWGSAQHHRRTGYDAA